MLHDSRCEACQKGKCHLGIGFNEYPKNNNHYKKDYQAETKYQKSIPWLLKVKMSDSVTIIECSDGKALKKDKNIFRLPERSTKFQCEICNIKSSSQCDYDTHLSGKKHLKKLANHCSYGKTLSPSKEVIPTGNLQKNEDKIADLVQSLTQEVRIADIYPKQKPKQFHCEICDVECSNQFHQAVIVQ